MAHEGAEDPHLIGRLIRANSAQLAGAIGREHYERQPAVVGLHDGGEEVAYRGSRCRENRYRAGHSRESTTAREADAQEACRALIDADVQVDRRRSERRRTRCRFRKDVCHRP
jgi:hypothetical protein